MNGKKVKQLRRWCTEHNYNFRRAKRLYARHQPILSHEYTSIRDALRDYCREALDPQPKEAA